MFAVRSTSAVAANAAAIRRVGAKKFNPLAAHVARKAPVAKARFSVQANSSSPSPDGEVDLYRDTPLRYMGYSNEVGEAFVAFLPGWGVPASYGVAGTSRARATSRTFEISARKRKISPRHPPARGRAPRAPELDSAETDRADPSSPHPISALRARGHHRQGQEGRRRRGWCVSLHPSRDDDERDPETHPVFIRTATVESFHGSNARWTRFAFFPRRHMTDKTCDASFFFHRVGAFSPPATDPSLPLSAS